jgi:hypothetical protein
VDRYTFQIQWSPSQTISQCNATVPSPDFSLVNVTSQCTGPQYYVPTFKWLNEVDDTVLFVFQVLYQNSINGAAATVRIPASEVPWIAWEGPGEYREVERQENGGYAGASNEAVEDGKAVEGSVGGIIVQRYVGPTAFQMAPIPV